ncbi:MAG: hypothetical protein ACRDWI_05485 [Jiangellaceae bacterium]
MLAFLAWFTERGPAHDAHALGLEHRMAGYLLDRASPEWRQHNRRGEGWGLFAAASDAGNWQWDLVRADESITAVSVGLPVGLPPELLARGPVELARNLVADAGLLSDVVPPFGLVAVDEANQTFVVSQDWLGMARLYVYRSQGVVAFSNRPSMLPYVFGDTLVPDPDGWAHYIGGDAFNDHASPVRGVTQIPAGEVVTGRRRDDGCWELITTRRRAIDEFAAEAASQRTARMDLAAEGVRRAGASLGALWPGPIPFGLSGGKDSRLVAAAMLAAGVVPRFSTRADSPAEAETATGLVELARLSLGREIEHTVTDRFTPTTIAVHDLYARARKLLIRYDFAFGSTYLLRPPVTAWPAVLPPPTVGGAAGEIATSKWVPTSWLSDDAVTHEQLLAALAGAVASQVGFGWQSPIVRRRLSVLVQDLADRVEAIGLRGGQALHWTYLVTRMRRWSTAGDNLHQITPLLTPEFLQVAFAMTLAEKREAAVHRRLTEQLMPSWAGVAWVKNSAGLARSEIPQVWDGDGLAVLDELVERPGDELTTMLDQDALRAALRRAKLGKGTISDGNALRVFTMLSAAADLFGEMNDEVRHARAWQPPELVTPNPRPSRGGVRRRTVRRWVAAMTPFRIRRTIRSALKGSGMGR